MTNQEQKHIPERWQDWWDLCDGKSGINIARATLKKLIEELGEAELERDVQKAKVSMASNRLGGMVEGHSTGTHNFLQRIDELVAAEAERDALKAEVANAHKALGAMALAFRDDIAKARREAMEYACEMFKGVVSPPDYELIKTDISLFKG